MSERTRTLHVNLHEKFDLTREAERCIGYLATWAIGGDSGRYSGVLHITGDADGNLAASYHDRQGTQTYFIHGHRDSDGSFSTHS